MKVLFNGKNLKALLQVDWKAEPVRRKEEPYQSMELRLWNSSVILWMVVAIMVCELVLAKFSSLRLVKEINLPYLEMSVSNVSSTSKITESRYWMAY
jgi:hypothetical protein